MDVIFVAETIQLHPSPEPVDDVWIATPDVIVLQDVTELADASWSTACRHGVMARVHDASEVEVFGIFVLLSVMAFGLLTALLSRHRAASEPPVAVRVVHATEADKLDASP
jgi:hypothetical protein